MLGLGPFAIPAPGRAVRRRPRPGYDPTGRPGLPSLVSARCSRGEGRSRRTTRIVPCSGSGPIMLVYFLVAAAVLLASMTIQAIALAATVRFVSWPLWAGPAGLNFWRSVGVATVVMLILLTALLAQIAVWAGAFVICGALPDFETAFYHSAVNFTTLGYGDIVMPPAWRLLGPLEAANGVLMSGLSASALFAVLLELRLKGPPRS